MPYIHETAEILKHQWAPWAIRVLFYRRGKGIREVSEQDLVEAIQTKIQNAAPGTPIPNNLLADTVYSEGLEFLVNGGLVERTLEGNYCLTDLGLAIALQLNPVKITVNQ